MSSTNTRTDRFPWDPSSDRVLQLAAELDPADHSSAAEYVREVAESVREHRAGARNEAGRQAFTAAYVAERKTGRG